jgi:GNAT superfamily N-acetyltransferase
MAQDTAVNDNSHEARAQLQDAAEATAVIAAVSAGDSAVSSQQKAFTIAIPPEEAAQDDKLIQYLTDLVNRVYFDAEASFWTPGFKRTKAAEVQDYLNSRALALAWRGDSSFSQHGHLSQDLLGCANIKMFPHEETGEFGMLACDPVSRGVGVGRELLRFAEDEARRRGARRMRLELLQGDGWRHDFKARLEAWYGRSGYQLAGVEDVQKNWPFLVPLLAKPMVMKVFIKQL